MGRKVLTFSPTCYSFSSSHFLAALASWRFTGFILKPDNP